MRSGGCKEGGFLTIEQWTDVDRYITDLLIDDVPSFDAADLPAISVSPPQGKFLHLIARALGARRILEIGTLAGYSAIWMARALPPDGRLITLELDEHHADIARTNIARANLSDRVEVRVGAALDTLPELEGPFDLTFIDADKANIPEYFSWAQRLS